MRLVVSGLWVRSRVLLEKPLDSCALYVGTIDACEPFEPLETQLAPVCWVAGLVPAGQPVRAARRGGDRAQAQAGPRLSVSQFAISQFSLVV